jgi:hypothetical protein
MLPRRAATALSLLGAALGLYAFACSVADLDEHGKSCVDTCPSGLPCIGGVCGGTADASITSEGGAGGDGAVEAGPPTDCPPGTCAAPAPAGWTGPFQLYDGNPANAPTCPSAAPVVALQANEDIVTPPAAQCSTCTCGGVTGAKCGFALIAGSNTCTCPAADFTQASYFCYYSGAFTNCINPPGGSAAGVVVKPASADGGACPPDGGVATRPPVTWQRTQLGCMNGRTAAAGCSSGQICLPAPASPFEHGLCVAQDGDVGCPGAPYTVKRLFHKSTNDTRACTACSCGAASGVACPTTIKTFSDQNCINQTGTLPVTTCPDFATYTGVAIDVGAATGGSCTPTGGAPTGTAVPSQPVTVCCTP